MDEMRKKGAYILASLSEGPLDRLRLTKALFLTWLDLEKPGDFFEFRPYNYGPFSTELYAELHNMVGYSTIIEIPTTPVRWSDFALSERGRQLLDDAKSALGDHEWQTCRKNAVFARTAQFIQLLKKVYEREPSYAINSIMLDRIRSS